VLMADPIKRALTKRRRLGNRPVVVEEPDERLVLGVKFAIGMTAFLSALELAHMAILHSWNAEIFASITGLSGTVIGLFVGQKT
jgi:hypothetical protein